jgi:hypothetical protein
MVRGSKLLCDSSCLGPADCLPAAAGVGGYGKQQPDVVIVTLLVVRGSFCLCQRCINRQAYSRLCSSMLQHMAWYQIQCC